MGRLWQMKLNVRKMGRLWQMKLNVIGRWEREEGCGYLANYYYEGVTPLGCTQKYYIAGGSGEEKKQENTEK